MLQDLRLRLRSLFNRRAVERELAAELTDHFEHLVAQYISLGSSRDEAIRRARMALGGVDQVLEAHRDARGTAVVENLLRDVAYALRQMRRAPGFAGLAVLCLGLGIGVNTAIFGVVNAVLLRPMPVLDPDRLVLVSRSQGGAFAFADYRAFREQANTLTGVAATMPMESDLDVGGDSDIAVAEVVSANYGEVMGVPLALGRWFTHDDEPSAVISDVVWERDFQRAPDILGRIIGSESQAYTIVGVAPPAFGGVFAPMRTDLWVPVRTRPRLWARLETGDPFNMLMVFGRLVADRTTEQAAAELTAIDARITRPPSAEGTSLGPIVAQVVRGQPNRGGRDLARSVSVLLGAVVIGVLLIACANVGHLLLARGALRRRELAMRLALGASRARLVQQLVVEAVLLSAAGAAVGLVLAVWTNRLLQATFPAAVSVFALHLDMSLDWRALVFASLAALATAVATGLIPAMRASDVRPDESFKGVRSSGRTPRRAIGLVMQVVTSLVLLFVAASFLRGLDELQRTTPGFEIHGRVYAHTALPAASGASAVRQQFYDDALARLRAIPGVQRAALTSILPLIPSGSDCVASTQGARIMTTASEVSPAYFSTLGIPLVAGEEFSPASLTSAPAAVIVNETLAKRAWPNGVALGQLVEIGCDSAQRGIVVGVARDTAVRRVGESAQPHLYRQIMRRAGGSFTTIVLATSGDAGEATRVVRDTLTSMGQGVRVYDVQPLSVPVEQSYEAPRWVTRVLAAFGLLALVLAAVGLFGITAHRVSQRTQEIGVRMALGARRADIFREVLREGLMIVLMGVIIGEVLSVGLTGAAAWTLEGVARAGVSTHLLVAGIWLGVAACACYLPSAWAARVDPVIALRHE